MKEIATLAAGCFWGVEDAFMVLKGVLETEVGYTGGKTENPTYKQVCTGTTGHAEAVRIEFDPEVTSFSALLDVFWIKHDPTTKDRQGPDIGSQYRSAIFYHSENQKRSAEESLKKQKDSLSNPIVTEIVEAQVFYPAEEYHQKYYKKNNLRGCSI